MVVFLLETCEDGAFGQLVPRGAWCAACSDNAGSQREMCLWPLSVSTGINTTEIQNGL